MAAAAQQLFSHRIIAVGDGAADLKLAVACDRTKCSVRRFPERPGLERGARVLLSNHDNLPVNRGKTA
jgi:hypothetical protein